MTDELFCACDPSGMSQPWHPGCPKTGRRSKPLCDCEPGPGIHGDRTQCPVHGVSDEQARIAAHAWARSQGLGVEPPDCVCAGCVRGLGQRVGQASHRLARMRAATAFAHGPTGTWAQRWIPGVCDHELIRCTHGDEIIGRRFRRRVCMVCGRALKGELPEICFFTDEPHPGVAYNLCTICGPGPCDAGLHG